MKYQSLFSGRNKKNNISLSSAELLRVAMGNMSKCLANFRLKTQKSITGKQCRPRSAMQNIASDLGPHYLH